MSYLTLQPTYYPSWLQPQRDPVLEAKQKELESNRQKVARQQQELLSQQQGVEANQKELLEFKGRLEKRKLSQMQSELDNRLVFLQQKEKLAKTEERVNEKQGQLTQQSASIRKTTADLEAGKKKLEEREKRLDARERQLERREKAVALSHSTIDAETARVNRSKKEVVDLSKNAIEALKAFGSRCDTLLELCKTRKLSELIPVDPVSLDPLEFPVVDENGHSFELPSLLHWLERKKSSPVTNNSYQKPDFHPQNYALRELIGKFAQLDEENEQMVATLEEEVKRFNRMLKGLTKEMVQVEQPLKLLREEREETIQDMPEIGITENKLIR